MVTFGTSTFPSVFDNCSPTADYNGTDIQRNYSDDCLWNYDSRCLCYDGQNMEKISMEG